jgi:hypothetical protein
MTTDKMDRVVIFGNSVASIMYIPGYGLMKGPRGGCWPGPPPELLKQLELACRLTAEAAAHPAMSEKLLNLANEVLKPHDKEIQKLCDAAAPAHV